MVRPNGGPRMTEQPCKCMERMLHVQSSTRSIERLHERIAHIFRHCLFQGHPNKNAGIGSRACRLHVPAFLLGWPREIPELYAKPYSLTVNLQSLHFYFSCMHSARMLRSVGKYNTDCAILSCNVSIESNQELASTPQICALHGCNNSQTVAKTSVGFYHWQTGRLQKLHKARPMGALARSARPCTAVLYLHVRPMC